MYNQVLQNMIFPVINQFYSVQKNTMDYHGYLEKTQYLPKKELEQIQKKQLRKILKFSYTHVPYYHQIFKKLNLKPEDIKEITDLNKLPFLTKEDVINNFNELIPKNKTENQVIPSFTGGTTGKRMTFYIDNHWEACNMAAAFREWGWAGYELGDKMVYLWGSLNDVKIQNQIKVKLFNMIQRIQVLNAYDITEETLNSYVKTLNRFNPKIINAYASAAYIMGTYLQKEGIESIQPQAVLTSCETLLDYQRNMIEKNFHCDVFDYYSARDTSLHAAECSEHSGYHTTIENGIVEFIQNGHAVSEGELGELTITDFCNYAMPFIRYKIGDAGIPSDETCSCGRTLPLIKKILGRITDMIVTIDGKYIPGLYFIHIFDTDAIKKYQLIQKSKDSFIIKIVKGNSYTLDAMNTIVQKIKEKCGPVNIEIQEVEEIPLTPSGKYRFIISELNNHL